MRIVIGCWLLALSSCTPAPETRVVTAKQEPDAAVAAPSVAAVDAVDAGAASADAAAPANAKVECSEPTAPAPHPMSCGLAELTGAPPCEWSCRVNEPPRKGAKTRKSHQVIYAADGNRARELLRIEVFSGPANPSPEDVLMKGVDIFVDESTSPPTLEARKGNCFFPAARAAKKRAPDSSDEEQEAVARAACPPVDRYRFERDAFKKLP